MARIRTIKPEFFRHEDLQDLEVKYPSKYLMLTFAGLWTQADANGIFPWRPRALKLDILPFLPFDMAETLDILKSAGYIKKYSAGGKEYGVIVSFRKHQRITGKEANEGGKHPQMTPTSLAESCETAEPAEGNNGETTGKHPVAQEKEKEKEKEKEREKERNIGQGVSPGDKSPDPVPHEKIIELWHQTLPTLPRIKVWGDRSRANLRARWREDQPRQKLEWWGNLFAWIKQSDFLMGKTERPFVLTLSWLVNATNFEKVLNGTYHKNKGGLSVWEEIMRNAEASIELEQGAIEINGQS